MPLPLRSQSTRRLLAWVLAVLIGTGIVLPVIPDPQIDLAVYLRGGQEALSGSDSLYTASESWPLPFTYPPFAALLFAPWSLIPPLILRVGLVLLSTAALARTLLLILRALEREGYALRIPAVGAVFAVLCALFAEPVLTTLRLGQVNLILGWMIVEDLLPRRRYGRGILVGLAAAIKLTPAVFGLVLLLRRDWRGLAGAIAAGMLATGIGYFALPHSTWDFLTRAVRDPARVGGVAYSSNQSLNGALWRATSPGGGARAVARRGAHPARRGHVAHHPAPSCWARCWCRTRQCASWPADLANFLEPPLVLARRVGNHTVGLRTARRTTAVEYRQKHGRHRRAPCAHLDGLLDALWRRSRVRRALVGQDHHRCLPHCHADLDSVACHLGATPTAPPIRCAIRNAEIRLPDEDRLATHSESTHITQEFHSIAP